MKSLCGRLLGFLTGSEGRTDGEGETDFGGGGGGTGGVAGDHQERGGLAGTRSGGNDSAVGGGSEYSGRGAAAGLVH